LGGGAGILISSARNPEIKALAGKRSMKRSQETWKKFQKTREDSFWRTSQTGTNIFRTSEED